MYQITPCKIVSRQCFTLSNTVRRQGSIYNCINLLHTSLIYCLLEICSYHHAIKYIFIFSFELICNFPPPYFLYGKGNYSISTVVFTVFHLKVCRSTSHVFKKPTIHPRQPARPEDEEQRDTVSKTSAHFVSLRTLIFSVPATSIQNSNFQFAMHISRREYIS